MLSARTKSKEGRRCSCRESEGAVVRIDEGYEAKD